MHFLRSISSLLLAGAIWSWSGIALSQQPTPTPPVVTAPQTPTTVPPAAPATTPALPATPPAAEPAPAPDTPTDPNAADTSGDSTDDLSIGEIPAVQTEELTPDKARKALDAYVLVQTKYQDSPLENYDDLQGFVDKDPKGKEFETDIKAFGFANVNDWNLAVTTLSFAYTNILDDQTSDITQQIEEITASTEMAQDMKDRMIASLKAMIPSPNNNKIVTDLIADPVYGEKIKLLETTEE
jgi:hypothetical protein